MNIDQNIVSLLYAFFGFVVVSNLGAILTFAKNNAKREAEFAVLKVTMNEIRSQLNELKGFQAKAAFEISEAHAKIREMKAIQNGFETRLQMQLRGHKT